MNLIKQDVYTKEGDSPESIQHFKKIKQVYIFTEKELEEYYAEAFLKGQQGIISVQEKFNETQ